MFIISDIMNYFSGLSAETIQIISSIAAVIASIVAIFVVFLTRYLSERDLKRKCVDALLSEIILNCHGAILFKDSINEIIDTINNDNEKESALVNKTKFHTIAYQNFISNGYIIQTSEDLFDILTNFYDNLNTLEERLKRDNDYFLFFHSDLELSEGNRLLNCQGMLEDINKIEGLYEDDLMPYIEGDEKIL